MVPGHGQMPPTDLFFETSSHHTSQEIYHPDGTWNVCLQQKETAMIVSNSADRVKKHTAEDVNNKIRRITEANVAHYALHPEHIDERLMELDKEWDIERTLQVNAAALAFTGIILGVLSRRWWLLLPTAVTGFLFQHGMQGWCPPLPVMRRLGMRTVREIEAERYALKALRGDFKDIPGQSEGVEPAVQATGRLS
jgi:hypothetical protein